MKKERILALLIVLLGVSFLAGCAFQNTVGTLTETQQDLGNSNTSPVSMKSYEEFDGLHFSVPKDFVVEGSGDTDSGTFVNITDPNNNDAVIFRILKPAHQICKEPGVLDCDIDELRVASSVEVLNVFRDLRGFGFSRELFVGKFLAQELKKLEGEEVSAEGPFHIVSFQSGDDVFVLQDFSAKDADKKLWNDFLASFE